MEEDVNYAATNIDYDLSEEKCHVKYLDVCSNVRKMERSEKMLGLLKREGLINIDFYPYLTGMQRPSRIVRLKMRNDDYYVVGFQRQGDPTLWEAADNGKKVLKNSKELPFTVSYNDKVVTGRTVSYQSFYNAVRTLGKLDPGTRDKETNDKIKDALFTIILLVAEGARFRWCSHFVGKTFENGIQDELRGWYTRIITHWKYLTQSANSYRKANPHITWPIEEPSANDIKKMEKYKVDKLFEKGDLRLAAVCVMIPLLKEKLTTTEAGPSKKGPSRKGRSKKNDAAARA